MNKVSVHEEFGLYIQTNLLTILDFGDILLIDNITEIEIVSIRANETLVRVFSQTDPSSFDMYNTTVAPTPHLIIDPKPFEQNQFSLLETMGLAGAGILAFILVWGMGAYYISGRAKASSESKLVSAV